MKAARLLMVLSSFAPLFVLWAVLGNDLIPDQYLVPTCLSAATLPTAFLHIRIRTAKKNRELRMVKVGIAEDHRDHLLVYLFTVLLPLYPVSLNTWRHLGAALIALGLVVFLFFHLGLHYTNLFFAVRGYRVFTIYPPTGASLVPGTATHHVLLSRRAELTPGEHVVAYRLSDTVLIEKEPNE